MRPTIVERIHSNGTERVRMRSRGFLRSILWVVLALAACWRPVTAQDQPSALPQTQQPTQPVPPPEKPAQSEQAEKPEVKITPRQAEELFHSVDEILEFDSKQTGLPIKHNVKRKLTSRDEVVAYLTGHLNDEDV